MKVPTGAEQNKRKKIFMKGHNIKEKESIISFQRKGPDEGTRLSNTDY